MTLRTWVSRHPILTYIILTMIWSFGFWSCLFLYMKPGELLKSPPPISFLFVALGGFGPSFGSLLITWLVYGPEGLQALWGRLRIRRVGGWWFALLVIPAVTALTPLLQKYHDYFKATFKGFIDLEFTKGENSWINIMHWETMEDVQACGEVLRTGPQEIAGYGALADRASTNLTFLERKLYLR